MNKRCPQEQWANEADKGEITAVTASDRRVSDGEFVSS